MGKILVHSRTSLQLLGFFKYLPKLDETPCIYLQQPAAKMKDYKRNRLRNKLAVSFSTSQLYLLHVLLGGKTAQALLARSALARSSLGALSAPWRKDSALRDVSIYVSK